MRFRKTTSYNLSSMKLLTESSSTYNHLEKMPVKELLKNINREDKTVAQAVQRALPQVERLANAVVKKMKKGGRLFYIGAGTSGRLGITDASECPPTFGVEHGKVIGIIAGGDTAIRRAVEFAEDDSTQGWKDLKKHNISAADVVIGITASGTTPYVVGAIRACVKNKITTGGITCNPSSPLEAAAQYPVVAETGPEFVTGSTRMKAGTAQKLILNMISTAVMIHLGHVKGNKMVDMQLTNNKLVERGTQMLMKELGLNHRQAEKLLLKHGSVRKAIQSRR
jgi:N-acetylmuramic acid 6-phosphate etherase